ncbi:hypothetical protein EVAR_38795_1 [Eumeta japonica]|uniref:Reverse transcriptase domain-containing protein n=1 Tax=Eumeta variegata TaxID=151549 RepID=A0A4C1WJI4_EUMVA|nr:hypothetical protein EVAR_38795_1 [Eumeta japonica]
MRRCVRQGCVSSPWRFNIFMGSCLYDLKEYEPGLTMDELSVKWLLYAGDQVILGASACGLQERENKMNDSVKKKRIKVNVGKNKVMVFERSKSTTECDILIESEKVEQVCNRPCERVEHVGLLGQAEKSRADPTVSPDRVT